jgi:hypothetical protein
MKLVSLIKMCLNETYSKVPIGKHLSENFPIQNAFALDMPLGRSRKTSGTEIKWDKSASGLR